MHRFRAFVTDRARLTAICVLALFALVYALPVLLYGPVDLTQGTGELTYKMLTANIIPQIVICGAILLIVAILGWWRQTRLTTPIDPGGVRLALWVTLFPFFLFLVVVIVITSNDPGQGHGRTLAIILLFNLLVGFFEETLFRGVLFHGLRTRYSLWVSLIASSVIFGSFHLVNLAIGQGWDLTLYQIINASALGLFLAAVMLQANSLWPAIVLHAIWNSYAMSGQLAMQTLDQLPGGNSTEQMNITVGPVNLILPLILTGLAIWIVKRWQRRMPPPLPTAAI